MKSIIIIGAGIAGLSAGCYGQMNGYRTQIFELHNQPGGLCTSWKRQGYTFDGCIHWLVGSGQGSSFNRIWRELGAAQEREMVNHDEFVRIAEKPRGEKGKEFIVYTDVDRLERHMLALAPQDGKPIREFCDAVRRLARFSRGERMDAGRIRSFLNMLPVLPIFVRYGKTTAAAFAARFQDPFLRHAFNTMFDMPDFPLIAVLLTLAWMHNRDAGYPIGGSLAFSQAIEKRYLDLGGEIHYRSRVHKILVENDQAVGVRLADGTEHRADVVISAADGHATIFDMLEEKYISDALRLCYNTWPIFPPLVQVSLGVARDMSAEPHMVTYPLAETVQIAEQARDTISVKHYSYDPTLAPPDRSVIEVMYPSDHAYWKAVAGEEERYEAEKKDIAIKVIAQLERLYPGIGDQVQVVDVATPLTYERYTGNWQGSMEGWLINTQNMRKPMDKTLPGLRNFYMCGQWVEPGGGLPTAAMSGRQAIASICKLDGQRFVAALP